MVSFGDFLCITASQWRSDIRCYLIQIRISVKYENVGGSGTDRKTRGVIIWWCAVNGFIVWGREKELVCWPLKIQGPTP